MWESKMPRLVIVMKNIRIGELSQYRAAKPCRDSGRRADSSAVQARVPICDISEGFLEIRLAEDGGFFHDPHALGRAAKKTSFRQSAQPRVHLRDADFT
jgi:hypothetical protein